MLIDTVIQQAENFRPSGFCTAEENPAIEFLRKLRPLVDAVEDWQAVAAQKRSALESGIENGARLQVDQGMLTEAIRSAVQLLREADYLRL